MFRAFVLSIVLTLTMGPDAAILCEVWCVPMADVTTTCDHDGAGNARIEAAGDCCDDMVAGAATSPFHAVRAAVSFPDGDHAMPVLRDDVIRATAASRLGYEPGRARSLDHRPLPTVLRI